MAFFGSDLPDSQNRGPGIFAARSTQNWVESPRSRIAENRLRIANPNLSLSMFICNLGIRLILTRDSPNTTMTIFEIISRSPNFKLWGTPGCRIKHRENTMNFLMHHQMPMTRCKTFLNNYGCCCCCGWAVADLSRLILDSESPIQCHQDWGTSLSKLEIRVACYRIEKWENPENGWGGCWEECCQNSGCWRECWRGCCEGGFPWKGIRSSTLASTPSNTPNFGSTLPSTLPSYFLDLPISLFQF